MSDFAKMSLSHVDAKGRDSNDRHYFGLVRSLTIGVRRMMDWCDRYDAQSGNSDTKKMAIGLMMAMSMLDRTKTPTSFFTDLDRDNTGKLEHGVSLTLLILSCMIFMRCDMCFRSSVVAFVDACILGVQPGHRRNYAYPPSKSL